MKLGDRLLRWLADIIVEAYLDDCRDRELRERTVTWYAWHLRRARDWLAATPGYHDLGILEPEGLAAYYHSTRGLAKNTRYHMVAALHAWGEWLVRQGLAANPAAGLQKPRRDRALPRALAPGELDRLLAVLEDEPARERALVLLLLDSGLRVSETAALRRGDVDLASGQITVRDGKGGQGRTVYVFRACCQALDEYLATHEGETVFMGRINGRPAPLTDSGIRQILRGLARRHGFEDLQPHTLRRTCGAELVSNGVDLRTVADQFGHADVNTTTLYTRLADTRRREVLRRASPVDRHMEVAGPDSPRGVRTGIPVFNWPRDGA